MDKTELNKVCNNDVEIITPRRDDKIRALVYNKIKIMILNNLNEVNLHNTIILIMRELNKQNLYGFSKKKLAVEIVTLLISECGNDDIKILYSMTAISEIIETIYINKYHKVNNNKCNIV